MRKLLYICFLPVAILSCSKNKDDKDQQKGYFILSQVNTLKSLKTTNSDAFDLGDIRKSNTFYFSIANGGSTPITDIKLSFSNNNFTISPTSIVRLDISNNISVSQILKVGVLHGTLIDGIGYTSLLTAGKNENILTISGKTVSGNETVNISENFTLQVNALIASLSLQSDSGNIDMTKYSSYGSVCFKDSCKNSGLESIRAHNYYQSNIKITNNGNIPLTISIFNRQDGIIPGIQLYSNYFKLNPGEQSSSLDLPLCPSIEYSYEVCLKVSCEGTVADINNLQSGSDGYIYFVLVTHTKQ